MGTYKDFSVGQASDTKKQTNISGNEAILFALDEEVMRTTAKMMLEDLGYDVVLSENGAAQLEAKYSQQTLTLNIIAQLISPCGIL